MDFAGQYHIPASPETVWSAVSDPDVLKACIPGCREMARTDQTHFQAAVQVKIGPVQATFKGKVALEDMEPPRRCTIVGEGQGGVDGFARGSAEVQLAAEDGGTLLSYTAKAVVGGKLAQIGQRLLDGAAKQLADEFFAKFAETVGGGDAAPGEMPPSEAVVPAPPGAAESRAPREGLTPEIWVVGLIGVIVILLVLFGVVL